jgi:acetoin utilization deacetylase AcuC-like enzyme
MSARSEWRVPDRPVALYYDPLFLGHDTVGHIESISRVEGPLRLLEESGVLERLSRRQCRDATEEELGRIHERAHIEYMRYAGERGPTLVLADTVANRGTYAAAVRAAGAVVGAVEGVVAGNEGSAFCLIRPPGHHAIAGQPMGFCFFNNVAVAACHATAAQGLTRVAIVDVDIHHGNGTQDAFYDDPNVLYVSTHQFPYYPGTGHWQETGSAAGRGATINVSLPAGCGDYEYGVVFEEIALPALVRFRPELILVSAGYDAHWGDPVDGAAMRLTSAGYAGLIGGLRDVADDVCDGRIVVALEGGYHPIGLPWSVRNTVEVMLGEKPTPDPMGAAPAGRAPDISELLTAIKNIHRL